MISLNKIIKLDIIIDTKEKTSEAPIALAFCVIGVYYLQRTNIKQENALE